MSLNVRSWGHALLLLLAAAIACPGAARAAACNGVVVTANTTKFWAKVTVLDPTKSLALDAGFIAPHSTKTWNGAASRGMCALPLYFQYEVTSVTGTTAPASVGNSIAMLQSGALMVLPANVMTADLWQVPQGPVGGPFWLDQTQKLNAISATNGRPLNALSCLKTADNKYFSVDDSTYCSKPPVAGPTASSAPSSAGCGTIITLNQSDHWAWITIYSLGKVFKYDWGWVAPHNFRAWHAGGAPTPMSYMCGSYYEVRYEIKQPRGSATPTDGPNLFDTSMQIYPELTPSDVLDLIHSVGDLLSCAVPEAEGLCAAKWGLEEGAQSALFGMIGTEANGSVVCAKSSDDKNFWLENSSDCATVPGKPGAQPLPPGNYKMVPPTMTVLGPGGMSGRVFDILRDGSVIDTTNAAYNSCKFSSDKPGVAQVDRPNYGHIVAYKAGTASVHWICGGKNIASATLVVKSSP
jgi:hypothetical protein